MIYKLDLDIQNTYLPDNNELSRARLPKVRPQTGQTTRHTHMRMKHTTTATFTGGKKQPVDCEIQLAATRLFTPTFWRAILTSKVDQTDVVSGV